MEAMLEHAQDVLRMEAEAILELVPRIDENFAAAVNLILECEGEHQDCVWAVVFALHRHAVDVLPERDALGDVHRKRGLADGRAGGDDDHVPRL